MSEATNPRRRSRWIVQGAIFGLLASLPLFALIGPLRSEAVDQIVTAYTRADTPDLGAHRLTTIWAHDVRQPSSIPSVASPWGDRYVSLTGGLSWSWDDGGGEDWVDLEEFRFSLHAVDASGERREELVPSERGERALDRLGGVIQTRDPYWFWSTYEPPAEGFDHFEIDLRIDGEEYTFALTEVER